MNIRASNDFKDSKVIFSVTVNVPPVEKDNPDKSEKYKYKTFWERVKDNGKMVDASWKNFRRNLLVKSEYSKFIKKHPEYSDFAIGKIEFKPGNSGAYYAMTKDWRNKNVERLDPSGNALKDKDKNTVYEVENIPLIESSVMLKIKKKRIQ